MNSHSSVAVCWICLDGEVDDKGNPLVRDCACRGSDAGFAHTSCIIKYAQKKCEEVVSSLSSHDFVTPWKKCPNCKQNYQNDLGNQLAAAFVTYAKETYGHQGNTIADKVKVMLALRTQIELNRSGADRNEEATREFGEKLIHELLALVDQVKKQNGMNEGWARMAPTTGEFQQYKFICSNFEANAYYCLGQVFSQCEERTNTEIGYYKKARDLLNSVGSTSQANHMTNCIERARSVFERNEANQLEKTKNLYKISIERFGEKSDHAILTGVEYAFCLRREYRSIEAERLLTNLAAAGRQLFGEEHNCTKQAVELLKKVRRRFVLLARPEDGNAFMKLRYRALRYENDGHVCIVTGPLADPSQGKVAEEQTFSIASPLVFPENGCPVMCHGLINATHLNGKHGDLRSVTKSRNGEVRFGVHFEEKKLGSVAVKPWNVRIVFDLPKE